MIRTWRSLFLYLICLGSNLLSIIPFFLIFIFWGRNLYFEKPPSMFKNEKQPPGNWCITFDLKKDVLKFWKYIAITLGPHLIIYRHGIRKKKSKIWSKTQYHEHTHSEQYESLCLLGLLVSILLLFFSHWLISLGIWASFCYLGMLSGFVVSWLRGENLYSGSNYEEAARTIADDYE